VPEGRVKWIEITKKGLTGQIPSDIDVLTYLTYFDLFENDVDGEVPETLCDLTGLTVFYIGKNPRVSGIIPQCIAELVNMVSIDFEATAQTGTIPPNFADMTKLREVWFSYGQSSLFSGVLPNFNSLNMKEFSIYSTNTLIGVFPDITNMSEFSWCQSKPSNLCRDPAVNVAVYEALGGECDAASLPICTDEDMTAIAAAQIEAADIQVKYNTARVEKKRFNALTPEEQAAEIAALSEAARFDALTSEEQAAEVAEAARFDALTPEEQAAEVAETARFNALTPEEQAVEIAALSLSSAGLSSFAAPGILSVLLLALAIV
jgi:hypothetical protein